jgi:hypothetical protein
VRFPVAVTRERGHRERCRGAIREQHVHDLMVDDVVIALRDARIINKSKMVV